MLVLLKASLGTRSPLLASHADGKMQILNQFVSFLLLCRNDHQIFDVYIVDNISRGSKISQTCRGWGGSVNPEVWAKNLSFGKIFTENCLRMKEIGPGGGRP